jgi:hypothetical protein
LPNREARAWAAAKADRPGARVGVLETPIVPTIRPTAIAVEDGGTILKPGAAANGTVR